MKKTLRIIGTVVGVVVLGLGSLFAFSYFSTSPLRSNAHDFFTLIGENKLEEAFEKTSTGFQQITPLESFKKFAAYVKFSAENEPKWTNWSIETGGVGSIYGPYTLNGTKYNVTVLYVKENDEWKIKGVDMKVDREIPVGEENAVGTTTAQ